MTAKGTLVAGPIQQNKYGGVGAYGGRSESDYEVVNHASTVADYDFGIENDEETKFETVSHVCSAAVKQARTDAKLTQAQLAIKVNEKTATIVELENGTLRYSAELINRIENALKIKIPRGRKPQQKGRK